MKKTKKIFAWVSLAIIAIFIIGLIYSLITSNGNLSMAMIVALIFFSILLYIIMNIFNKRTKKEK